MAKTQKRLKIEYVDPTGLNPNKYNPRHMTEGAKQKLAASLKANEDVVLGGLIDPIIVQVSGKSIIGGHQRTAIAIDLDYSLIPVVWLDVDDDYALALNVMLNNPELQGHWDYDKLQEVVAMVRQSQVDEGLMGFDHEHIDTMLEGWEHRDGGTGGGYDPEQETWHLRIEGVSNADKDPLIDALAQVMKDNGWQYDINAY